MASDMRQISFLRLFFFLENSVNLLKSKYPFLTNSFQKLLLRYKYTTDGIWF